jgi:hypothetical protein
VSVVAGSLRHGLGFAQFAGLGLPSWLAGGDHRSATFGNINMAAQFAGLTVVILLAVSPGDARWTQRRATDLAIELVAGGALAYAWLGGSRSVGLVLAAAAVVLILVGRLTMPRLLPIGAAAALLAVAVPLLSHGLSGPLAPALHQSKRASALWRLAV